MKEMDMTSFELGDSGIRRDYEANTWRVRVYDPTTKKVISKYFADKKYGGREGAYKLAVAYRDKVCHDIRKKDITTTPFKKKLSRLSRTEVKSSSSTVGTEEKSEMSTESILPIPSIGNEE